MTRPVFPRVVCALLILTFCFPACRKAEEDPWFSMRSRKARLVGEWTVKKYEEDVYRKFWEDVEHVVITSDEFTFNYWSDIPENVYWRNIKEYKYTFEKDGKFKIVSNFSSTLPDSSQNVEVTTRKGTWEFLGKSGEYKNKERVLLHLEEIIFTVKHVRNEVELSSSTDIHELPPFSNTLIITLEELRHKKMRASWDIINSIEYSENMEGLIKNPPTKNGSAKLELSQ